MPFISVTRLKVRSLRYLPSMLWQTLKVASQARHSPRFLGGRILREANNFFWTLTAWEDEESMRGFRQEGTHARVMPKLLGWCDEAAYAHWSQDSPELPDWLESHRRLVLEGKLSKVYHPSPAQVARHIVAPKPGRGERTLTPV